MSLKMALMGSGIARSRMPRLQHYLSALSGIAIDYGLLDGENVTGFDPVKRVQQAKSEGFYGLNVTHPYKQKIVDLVSGPIVHGHEAIGSYNTLKFENDEILGANTDFSGFISGYTFRRGDRAPGQVLICGAGGVGRAIAFALSELGASHIAIFDVVPGQAESLREALRERGTESEVVLSDQLEAVMQQVDGLVNCTALGMYSHPGSAFPLSAIGAQRWAFDAVYTPLETEFMKRCKAAGMQCLSGFDLWIFQGIDAFQLFTGIEVEANNELISTALTWLD
ncbi:shikimate dehydrogenase [Aestuariicella hydrocarbonica]|uniref:Shikimate dehydrogenase n=1 Tax=Pseudomaricurvus hydrocarbonicus TaxID=1470433 RepID=A0A9E5JWX0_9GAMM|nr:shikimate dehydrogenase [Aestuariicella hydrocarbonica]NHO66799.1 shikimate dehydrogenase [Aestuariicella hydrocarbonica]